MNRISIKEIRIIQNTIKGSYCLMYELFSKFKISTLTDLTIEKFDDFMEELYILKEK